MRKKGFTLIELLAVIVVLAIIALIAIPVILGVVDKAKIGAAQSSVLGYVDAVEKQIVINQTKNSNLFDLSSDKKYILSELTTLGVKIRGKIDDVAVTINKKGIVISAKFCINNYSIDYDGKKATINKDAEYCNGALAYIEKPIGTITQDLLDNNKTYGNYTYMGGTYLKGVQENNYVWYNGFLWRIMGKNSDGSIRLITEENVGAVAWGVSNVGNWNTSGYIKDWLNNYFLSNLDSSKANIIQNSNWCINTYSGTYAAGTAPVRTDCTGGIMFPSKIGLISLDEYNLSGASQTNLTYGLVNSQIYWTLTPYSTSNTWFVSNSGSVSNSPLRNTYGVRPVINVSADATITGGNGTLESSYILNQTKDDKIGKLNEKASSGEYVSLNNKTYRVVSKDSAGTKLIYDGYYEETTGTEYVIKYNGTTGNNVFVTTSGIGLKLNTDVLTWLGNSDKIVSTNWYQMNGLGYGIAYTTILNDTSNPINTKVGLIRVGEMMSGQSASILTKNYTVRSASENAKYYWTMNKYTISSAAWCVGNRGYDSSMDAAGPYGVRPVIVVNTNTSIASGNGTLGSPYIID